MATTSRRVVFLTGAPEAACLAWDAQSCVASLTPRFQRYLGVADRDNEAFLHAQTQATALAKWRHVPLKGEAKRAAEATTTEAPQFLSFEDEGEDQPSQEHMRFLEHSLAVLQNLDSSQVAAPDQTTYNETTFVSALSFVSDLSTSIPPSYRGSFSTNASEQPSQHIVNFTGPITDLRTIPTARYLESIHPQTMTINCLVSVISIQPTRTVKLRKRSGEMDIVEVLVGDDTRAGFNVSFWLPPTDSQRSTRSDPVHGGRSLRDVLNQLRPADALLVTHIALGEFKGTVYGQSLSKRITMNNTSIFKLPSETMGLPAPSMAKLTRVIEWTGNFVGRPVPRTAFADRGRSTSNTCNSILPPDTQTGEL